MLHTVLLTVSRPKGKQGPLAEIEEGIGLAMLADKEGIGLGPQNLFALSTLGGEMVNVGLLVYPEPGETIVTLVTWPLVAPDVEITALN